MKISDDTILARRLLEVAQYMLCKKRSDYIELKCPTDEKIIIYVGIKQEDIK